MRKEQTQLLQLQTQEQLQPIRKAKMLELNLRQQTQLLLVRIQLLSDKTQQHKPLVAVLELAFLVALVLLLILVQEKLTGKT